MSTRYEWEEDDEPSRLRPEPRTTAATDPGHHAVTTGIALGHLDRAWKSAAAPVRSAWLRGLLDREASASAAIEGYRIPPTELLAAEFDCQIRPSLDLRFVQRCRTFLTAVLKRSHRQLYTPLRLAALARHTQPPRQPHCSQPELDETPAAALQTALSAEPTWRALNPVCGMAALLTDWHHSGATYAVSGVAGRALAARWPARTGAINLPFVPVALGFRPLFTNYAPSRPDWPHHFATTLHTGLSEALSLLDTIEADRAALLAWASQHRKPQSWLAAIDALHHAGALSSTTAAKGLGLTPRAASYSLAALASTPYVREISGRASWRIYVPQALAASR